jgi:hypothetical protein
LNPDLISLNADPDSTLPVASICFDDAAGALGQCIYALGEAHAGLVWFREHVEPSSPIEAAWTASFYIEDAAMRLYVFAEHLANAITCAMEISGDDLRPYRRLGASDQRQLHGYLTETAPSHPFTAVLTGLWDSADWQAALEYRHRVVHEQAPTIHDMGFVYRRGRRGDTKAGIRWSPPSSTGARVLAVGTGDVPERKVDDLLEETRRAAAVAHIALCASLDQYVAMLATRGITIAPWKP